MASDKKQFDHLLEGFLRQSLTGEELTEFFELLRLPENEARLAEALDNDLQNMQLAGLGKQEQLAEAHSALIEKINGSRLKWLAAASVILVAGLTAGMLFFSPAGKKQPLQAASSLVVHDIAAPDASRAILTLSNGQQMFVDSAGSGELAKQGQTSVIKMMDGHIVYKGAGAGSGMQYNTLSVPRGSRIARLSLEDGTRVWVNAGSSLKYPVAFTGKERSVEIMGEAYFEVSRSADQPFMVHINTTSPGGGSMVQVLGTHFNINAYGDEEDVKVTLLEGSVRVHKQAATSLLQPGEQAQVSNRIKVVNDADAEETVAWRNGRFSYNNAGLEKIMRQISRWYGVEVVYDEKIADEYTINVPDTIPLSQLLKFIELSGGVHFMLDGKRVIVKK